VTPASAESGARRIFVYNWPTYVATWTFGLAAAGGGALWLAGPLGAALAVGGAAAVAWSLASLAISTFIYDRSPLSAGAWVAEWMAPGAAERRWAMVHAGLDAEIALGRALPGPCVGRLDIYDPSLMSAPSILRARAHTARCAEARSCSPTSLPLDDGSCDALVVAFTAHEIRDRAARERFFEEARRVLAPKGRMLVVEHLRDLPNFVAYGPGFLHFLSRAEWLRLARHAGLTIRREGRVTPWVMALSLERALEGEAA
jgi:SAM-dependent methyltransferase